MNNNNFEVKVLFYENAFTHKYDKVCTRVYLETDCFMVGAIGEKIINIFNSRKRYMEIE